MTSTGPEPDGSPAGPATGAGPVAPKPRPARHVDAAVEVGPTARVPGHEAAPPAPPHRSGPAPARRPPTGPVARRRARPPVPLPGFAALVTVSLLATFFAWVSAAPIWLAVGHSIDGTAVIAECTGGGLTRHCRGAFLTDGGRFVARDIRLTGVPADSTATGTALPARMTGTADDTAYADTGVTRHLRWLLGLLLVLACGAGIARCTGATGLPNRRERRWAVGAALAGPLLMTVGFLVAAW